MGEEEGALKNFELCDWSRCGGHALYETILTQNPSDYNQSWENSESMFVTSIAPWFVRGGASGRNASIFASSVHVGDGQHGFGFTSRAALIANP